MPRSKVVSIPPAREEIKRPGEDSDYDAWFEEQVKIGLEQLERGETVSDEVVKEKYRRKRAELLRQASEIE